jgi:hypothetical protein
MDKLFKVNVRGIDCNENLEALCEEIKRGVETPWGAHLMADNYSGNHEITAWIHKVHQDGEIMRVARSHP